MCAFFCIQIIIVSIKLSYIIPHRGEGVKKEKYIGTFSLLRPIWKAVLRSHIFILIIYPGFTFFYLLKIYVPREAIEWRQHENRKCLNDSKLRALCDIKYRDEIALFRWAETIHVISHMCCAELPLKINLMHFFFCATTADN